MLFALGDIPVKVFTADEVLSPYVYVFYAAFIVSFIFTPIMRAVATHFGIVDKPDGTRKIHREPVAYLGGAAVFLGWIFGLAIAQFTYLHRTQANTHTHVQINFSIIIAACVIVLLGLKDDITGVRPKLKIAGQVLAAVFLLSLGVGTHSAQPLLETLGDRLSLYMYGTIPAVSFFPEYVTQIVSGCLVISVVVGCCNATNLMDGLDGLCGGVTGIIAFGYLFLAVHMAMYGGGNVNADALRIVLGLSLLGAVLGFIPYNFNPASIFMGDTGSMFMGFAIATQIILMAEESPKWFLAGMVMFALPVLDTSLAFVRRYVNGRPFFAPDKHHIHHQLMARGLTVKKTVLSLYAMAIGFCLLGASVAVMRTRYAGAAYLVTFGSIIVAAYKMGMVHEQATAVDQKFLDESDIVGLPADIEPSLVLEVKERLPARAASAGNAPGIWEQPVQPVHPQKNPA